jgi:hypothetical protein
MGNIVISAQIHNTSCLWIPLLREPPSDNRVGKLPDLFGGAFEADSPVIQHGDALAKIKNFRNFMTDHHGSKSEFSLEVDNHGIRYRLLSVAGIRLDAWRGSMQYAADSS